MKSNNTAKEIINVIDETLLKKFLIEEVDKNKQLEENIIKKFDKNSLIDPAIYTDKLNKIIDMGKGKHFDLHGIYEIEVISDALVNFIYENIFNLLELKEYGLVEDLLTDIRPVIMQDASVNTIEWYSLIEAVEEVMLYEIAEDRFFYMDCCPSVRKIYDFTSGFM